MATGLMDRVPSDDARLKRPVEMAVLIRATPSIRIDGNRQFATPSLSIDNSITITFNYSTASAKT